MLKNRSISYISQFFSFWHCVPFEFPFSAVHQHFRWFFTGELFNSLLLRFRASVKDEGGGHDILSKLIACLLEFSSVFYLQATTKKNEKWERNSISKNNRWVLSFSVLWLELLMYKICCPRMLPSL